ncbi:MAG: single-stranded DNA-binding protein [Magnetococcales bacterium]|nr:single-stranded DNA-binding protein [Magnetococcales bacterium]
MSRSLNKVQLIGNLGADPEVRFTQDGRPIANLNIATSDSWKDKQGQPQERTEWHRVVIFGKLAEIAQQYCRKGGKVYIEGQLQTRKWTDNQGQDRYTTEIVLQPYNGQLMLLDRPGGGAAPGAYPAAASSYGNPQQGYGASHAPDPMSDYRPAPLSPPPPPPPAGNRPAAAHPPLDDFAQTPNFDDDIPF